MKALSLKEPYADLVASGKKTIETRKWCVPYNMFNREILLVTSKIPKTENSGLAICTFKIDDCVRMNFLHEKDACCPVYPGAFAWLLYDVRRIKPFPVRGMLKFFEVDLNNMGIKIQYLDGKNAL